VTVGKNLETRKALLDLALASDETYQKTKAGLREAKLRLGHAEGELEAQRTRLGLVKAWCGREAQTC
jgi:hypothetical protein